MVMLLLLTLLLTRQEKETAMDAPGVTTPPAQSPVELAKAPHEASPAPVQPSPESSTPPVVAQSMPQPATESPLIREELIEIYPPVAELAKSFDAGEFSEMDFPLFDGDIITLTHIRHQELSSDSGILRATVKNSEGTAQVVLSYAGNALTGSIRLPGENRFYEIHNASPAHQVVLSQIDPAKLPGCGVDTRIVP